MHGERDGLRRIKIVSLLQGFGFEYIRGESTVVTTWTEPNQIAISSWTILSADQGFDRGAVSIIHWMQSCFNSSATESRLA